VTTDGFLRFMFALDKQLGHPKGNGQIKLLRVEASGNVFDAKNSVVSWLFDKVIPTR